MASAHQLPHAEPFRQLVQHTYIDQIRENLTRVDKSQHLLEIGGRDKVQREGGGNAILVAGTSGEEAVKVRGRARQYYTMSREGTAPDLEDDVTQEAGQTAAVELGEETGRVARALQPDPHAWQ